MSEESQQSGSLTGLAKRVGRELHAKLLSEGVRIGYQRALDVAAYIVEMKDWNTLSAVLNKMDAKTSVSPVAAVHGEETDGQIPLSLPTDDWLDERLLLIHNANASADSKEKAKQEILDGMANYVALLVDSKVRDIYPYLEYSVDDIHIRAAAAMKEAAAKGLLVVIERTTSADGFVRKASRLIQYEVEHAAVPFEYDEIPDRVKRYAEREWAKRHRSAA